MNAHIQHLFLAVANVTEALRNGTLRGDRGQTSSEYLGILVLVGAIIIAIFTLNIDDTIANAIKGAVDKITNAGGG